MATKKSDDSLVITSSKEYLSIVISLFAVSGVLFFLGLQLEVWTWLGWLITAIFVCTSILYWITYCRIFIMDRNGCTVKFGPFSKIYKWSELKVKSVEYNKNAMGYRVPYCGWAVFSPRKSRKPKWIKPGIGIFQNPFTFIFVYFTLPQPRSKWSTSCPDTYEVEESEFLARMKEWNVDIQFWGRKEP